VLVAVALMAVYGWWAVGLPPFSGAATVAVVGAGVVAAWAGWHRRRSGGRARGAPEGGLAWWAVVVQHPRDDHPTLSSLTNVALDSQVARTAGFVAWIIVTVGLVRR
jgi:hypothetical protein